MDNTSTGASSQAAAGNDKVVPVEVVQAIREEAKSWKDIAIEQQKTIQALSAEGPKPGEGTPTKEEDSVEKVFEGMEDDDVLTAGDVKKIVGALTKATPKSDASNTAIAEISVMLKNPDYEEVVKTYLPELLKEKPHLASAIRKSDNPYLTALDLAKTSAKYVKDKAAKDTAANKTDAEKLKEAELAAQKAKENLEKVKSGHEFSGSSGGLGKAQEYENMSDDDLEARIAQVKRGK